MHGCTARVRTPRSIITKCVCTSDREAGVSSLWMIGISAAAEQRHEVICPQHKSNVTCLVNAASHDARLRQRSSRKIFPVCIISTI